jgi:Toxin SymE, type I toxin-antitoxin system
MPFLRLQGRWLEAAGFAIGAEVRIAVSAGRLVLEVIDPAQTQAQSLLTKGTPTWRASRLK